MKRTSDTHCACFRLFAVSITPGKTENKSFEMLHVHITHNMQLKARVGFKTHQTTGMTHHHMTGNYMNETFRCNV